MPGDHDPPVWELRRMLARLSDLDLVVRLRDEGCAGPAWPLVRARLAEICIRTLHSLLLAGELNQRTKRLLDTRHTLAVVNGLRGRFATAEQELRALLDDRIRLLGPEDRETLATRDYLAWILGRQGSLVEALDVAEAVLADRSRLLGDRHLHTLTSRYRIAWLTSRDGRWDEAREQLDRLRPDLVDVLGPDHPDTLRCRHGLVRLRRPKGEHAAVAHEALTLMRDQIRVQGADAVDTLRAAEELGLALRRLPGREAAAATLLGDVLRRRDLELDEDHPDTVRLRTELRHG